MLTVMVFAPRLIPFTRAITAFSISNCFKKAVSVRMYNRIMVPPRIEGGGGSFGICVTESDGVIGTRN